MAKNIFRILSLSLVVSKALAAPVQQHQSGGEEHIVIIDKNHPAPPRVAEVLERLSLSENHADVRHVYNNSAFQGFAATMKSHCLDLLSNMADVSLVEKAVRVSSASVSSQDPFPYNTRPNAPWGLQRISTSSSVGGSSSSMDYTYTYSDSSLGTGADIYVIDTGIYTAHNVFNGRAEMIWAFPNTTMTDEDGHGTHVSGTAAGAILGVASNANLFGLKALGSDGTGVSSDIVAAIDYVIQTHEARQELYGANFTGSVISMSLASSEPISAIDAAIVQAANIGVHACVAAGNSGTDACSSSPAASGGTQGPAITVGAIDINAQRASFSNTGKCVDVYAPGVDIISAWIGAPNMVNTLDGTSMATPHVTGLVAYTMANNKTLASDARLMKEYILSTALQLPDGTLMVNNGVQAAAKDGLLGFEKTRGYFPRFTMADSSSGSHGPR